MFWMLFISKIVQKNNQEIMSVKALFWHFFHIEIIIKNFEVKLPAGVFKPFFFFYYLFNSEKKTIHSQCLQGSIQIYHKKQFK